MAKFKVDAIDRKTTSTGKEMARLNLISEEGELLEGVSIWADYPGFKDFKPNDYIEGDYKENGQWKNLYPPKPAPAQGGGAMRSVAAAQTRKSEMIEKSQDRKEIAIMVSSTMRAATDITLVSLKDTPFPTDAEFEKEFTKWRNWYMKKWQETDKIADQPF